MSSSQTWFENYENHRGSSLRASSVRVYRAWWACYCTHLADSNIEPASATSSCAEQFLRKYAMNTAIRYYRLIVDVYDIAIESGLCKKNPLSALDKYFNRIATPVAVPAPTDTFVNALYSMNARPGKSWKKRRDRMLVLLTAETGLRRQEVLSLEINNLYLNNNPPYLRVTLLAHARRIELRPVVADNLRVWIEERRSAGVKGRLVYPTNLKGGPLDPSTAYRIIAAYMEIIGAGKNELGASGSRVLRSGFAHRHMVDGDSLTVIQSQLGHRQLMSTSDFLSRVLIKTEK
jgi:integrase